jgi:hypothetical protein
MFSLSTSNNSDYRLYRSSTSGIMKLLSASKLGFSPNGTIPLLGRLITFPKFYKTFVKDGRRLALPRTKFNEIIGEYLSEWQGVFSGI